MTSSQDLIKAARSLVAEVPSQPRRKTAVLTCIDARVDPLRILQATVGDLHILRNAGGLPTSDVMRSLVVSQMLLGTNRVMVLMHTECALHRLDSGPLLEAIKAETGQRPPPDFGGFDDLDARLRQSLTMISSSALLPHTDNVTGAIFDVRTNRLGPVIHA